MLAAKIARNSAIPSTSRYLARAGAGPRPGAARSRVVVVMASTLADATIGNQTFGTSRITAGRMPGERGPGRCGTARPGSPRPVAAVGVVQPATTVDWPDPFLEHRRLPRPVR